MEKPVTDPETLECRVLQPGEMVTLMHEDTPIVVTRSEKGDYHAVRGVCPHQGGLLGEGRLTWLTQADTSGEYNVERDGEIVRCPWHSFEFDVTTGRCVASPRLRVKTYPVTFHDGRILIEV